MVRLSILYADGSGSACRTYAQLLLVSWRETENRVYYFAVLGRSYIIPEYNKCAIDIILLKTMTEC